MGGLIKGLFGGGDGGALQRQQMDMQRQMMDMQRQQAEETRARMQEAQERQRKANLAEGADYSQLKRKAESIEDTDLTGGIPPLVPLTGAGAGTLGTQKKKTTLGAVA